MKKTLDIIGSIVESKLNEINIAHEKERLELQKRVLEYENRLLVERQEHQENIEKLRKTYSEEVKNATRIKWTDDGEYYNLSDFCKVTKYLLFIKETELKQWLFQQGVLDKDDSKYVPSKDIDICKMIDDELYIKYSFIRNKILLLRSLIFIGDLDDIDRIVETYRNNKSTTIEQMANTVYVECKQRSQEFKEHKENKFFIESRDINKLK